MDIKPFYKLYLDNLKDGTQKSIKANEIESLGGIIVNRGYTPLIDYLKAVDEYYFNEKK